MAFDFDTERLVKSSERVRDLGEVFTPASTVQEMLDLLPSKVWNSHPSSTFLEPSCGDGNFLISILDRKLDQVSHDLENFKLAAGSDEDAAEFHAIEALASIYAVDISVDNVIGGTPGHEQGARTRLLEHFSEWIDFSLGKKLTDRSRILRAAQWIVEHNIIVGNMLPLDAEGKATRRDQIPIIEYIFEPSDKTVILKKTTMGDILETVNQATAMEMSLFAPEEATILWEGPAKFISDADRVSAPKLRGPVRNGVRR